MTTYARIDSLANSIAAALNAAQPVPPAVTPVSPFCLAFAAVRKNLPIIDLTTMDDQVHVTVISANDPETRVGLKPLVTGTYRVSIVVQYKFQKSDTLESKVDDLKLLRQQIRDFCWGTQFTVNGVNAAMMESSNAGDMVLLVDELIGSRTFESSMYFEFKVFGM
jgi:hypothetical protein